MSPGVGCAKDEEFALCTPDGVSHDLAMLAVSRGKTFPSDELTARQSNFNPTLATASYRDHPRSQTIRGPVVERLGLSVYTTRRDEG